MKRLLVYLNNENLDDVFTGHSRYYEEMIQKHTKQYYLKDKSNCGVVYLTKFNPDIAVYENYYQHPDHITIKLKRKDKDKLQQILITASGLDLIKDKDYVRIQDSTNNELIGVSFAPLSDEIVNTLARVLE